MEKQKWSVEVCGTFYFQNQYGDWDATGEDELYIFENISEISAREEAISKYKAKYYRPEIEIVLEDIVVQAI